MLALLCWSGVEPAGSEVCLYLLAWPGLRDPGAASLQLQSLRELGRPPSMVRESPSRGAKNTCMIKLKNEMVTISFPISLARPSASGTMLEGKAEGESHVLLETGELWPHQL